MIAQKQEQLQKRPRRSILLTQEPQKELDYFIRLDLYTISKLDIQEV